MPWVWFCPLLKKKIFAFPKLILLHDNYSTSLVEWERKFFLPSRAIEVVGMYNGERGFSGETVEFGKLPVKHTAGHGQYGI